MNNSLAKSQTAPHHYETLTQAILKGSKLHAFLSGGGLRVVRLEKGGAGKRGGALVGYGEHPHVGDALRILADDYLAGGRSYDKVYGTGGLEVGYLTGSTTPDSPLDAHIRTGATFGARQHEGQIQFELNGYARLDTPKHVLDLVEALRAQGGRRPCFVDEKFEKNYPSVRWEARGRVYESYPSFFPGNDEPCHGTKCVQRPEGAHHVTDYDWHTLQVGLGACFEEALEAAFAAPAIEVP